MARDYYEVLGVSRRADISEIKSAYRRLAKKYHPDVSQVVDGEERFKEINEAYRVLSDRLKRARYDRTGSADFTSRGGGNSTGRRNEKRRNYNTNTKRKTRTEQKPGDEQNKDGEHEKKTESSDRQGRTEAPGSENMRNDSRMYHDDSENGSRTGSRDYVKGFFVIAFVVVAVLFFASPQIASFFLSLSRAANHTAHNEILASFQDPRPTYTLPPTYTPLPTHTQLPTHTPLPTYTPRPTYTPFPTPTPIPLAFVIQQLETQAQLVVVQNEIAMRDFHVGVDDGICSHGADFSAHGVIEAGIDFAAIDEERVTFDSDKGRYFLQLPAPEYTSCRIEYIRQVENTFSLCNPDWDRARIFAEAQTMTRFLKESEEEGLLLNAAEQSAEILEDFVRTLTGKPVIVDFDERVGKPKISGSCVPSVPGEWYFDDTDQLWTRTSS